MSPVDGETGPGWSSCPTKQEEAPVKRQPLKKDPWGQTCSVGNRCAWDPRRGSVSYPAYMPSSCTAPGWPWSWPVQHGAEPQASWEYSCIFSFQIWLGDQKSPMLTTLISVPNQNIKSKQGEREGPWIWSLREQLGESL